VVLLIGTGSVLRRLVAPGDRSPRCSDPLAARTQTCRLAAQNLEIVTADEAIGALGARRLW
jgi:hypothetical protein